MRLLYRNPITDGRTWRDPRNLDKLILRSPLGSAAFVTVGDALFASTDPMMGHARLRALAGAPYDAWSDTADDHLLESSHAPDAEHIHGYVTPFGAEASFDVKDTFPMKAQPDGVWVPDIPADTIVRILDQFRGHPSIPTAFPKGIKLRLIVNNYAGSWIYRETSFRPRGDQKVRFHPIEPYRPKESPRGGQPTDIWTNYLH